MYVCKYSKVYENFPITAWFSNFLGVIIKSDKHRGRFALGILSARKESLSKEVVVMKRLFAMLMLFVFVLSLCGCASSSSIGTMVMLLPVHLHFNYGDQSVNMILPPEEAEAVKEILDGKSYDPIGSIPSCGFDIDISLQVGFQYYGIALDQCNCVSDYSSLRYFSIPKEDMEYIHSLFEKYCGFEEYGGFY